MNKMMLGAGLLASVTLAGCFSDSGSADQGGTPQVQVSGVAVDGYVAGAWVYADLNNNGKRDGFEPRALTDAFGFYSYRPEIQLGDVVVPERDYCRNGPVRHCLRVAATTSEVTLRVEGGYDLLTGLPFTGSMSRRIAVPLSDGKTVLAVTPLTTLSGAVMAEGGDFWGDYFAEDVLDPVKAAQAYHLHQLLVFIARELLEDGTISEDILLAPLSAELYRQLVAGAVDSDVLQAWLDYEGDDFRELIIRALTAVGIYDAEDAAQDALIDELAGLAGELQDSIRIVLQDQDLLTDFASKSMAAGSRNPFPIILAIAQLGQSRADVDLSALFAALANTSALFADIEELEHMQNLDLPRLIEYLREQFIADGNLDNADLNEASINGVLPQVAGKQIIIEDEDSDAWAGLYFFGEPNDIEGQLRLCVSSDGVIDLSDYGDDDVISIGGSWSRPTPTQLVLTLSAFGDSLLSTASLNLGYGTDLSGGGGEFVWSFIFQYDGTSDRYVAKTNANDFDLLTFSSESDVECE